MSTYLSIDLDYWNAWDPDYTASDTLVRLINNSRKKNIPINVVMNHNQMLRFINVSKARSLVNIDMHSDLVGGANHLDCGSWVSYVEWRRDGEYEWIRNSWSTRNGDCNSFRNNAPKRAWNTGTDWSKVRSTYLTPNEILSHINLLWRPIEIGICLSPGYTREYIYKSCRLVLSGLPYVRGRLNERDPI